MRPIALTVVAALAFASAALAQSANQTTIPVYTKPVVTPEQAAAAKQNTKQMEDMLRQQLQKVTSNKNANMGTYMVIGQMMSCAQKTAGQQQTQAFYQEMDKVGKTAEAYCKANRAPEARTLILSTLAAKKNDPVMVAALGCYDAQAGNIATVGGQQLATDAAHYARWARDPAVAQTEMQDTDICRNKPKAEGTN